MLKRLFICRQITICVGAIYETISFNKPNQMYIRLEGNSGNSGANWDNLYSWPNTRTVVLKKRARFATIADMK